MRYVLDLADDARLADQLRELQRRCIDELANIKEPAETAHHLV